MFLHRHNVSIFENEFDVIDVCVDIYQMCLVVRDVSHIYRSDFHPIHTHPHKTKEMGATICTILRSCLGDDDMLMSNRRRLPVVTMDRKYKGPRVSTTSFVTVGDGIALANAALHQSRAYWEIKVLDPGIFCCGVSHRISPERLVGHLDQNKGGKHHWGCRFNDPDTKKHIVVNPGDTIGVMLDQSEVPMLHFQINGKPLQGKSIRGIRGLVFPSVSVSQDARLDANFGPNKFRYPIPRGFSGVIRAQDVI